MKYVIDAYAWIEYLEGSRAGEKVRKILQDNNEIFSLNLTISEVVSRIKRKGSDTEIAYQVIISNSQVAEISHEVAKEAGLLHAETRKTIKDFGIADSLILALARELNAKIITGDEHFRNFKEAILI